MITGHMLFMPGRITGFISYQQRFYRLPYNAHARIKEGLSPDRHFALGVTPLIDDDDYTGVEKLGHSIGGFTTYCRPVLEAKVYTEKKIAGREGTGMILHAFRIVMTAATYARQRAITSVASLK